MQQYNHILNSNGKLLDLVVGNMDCAVSKDSAPLVYEDDHHPSLLVCVKLSVRHNKSSNFDCDRETKKYNFRKANYITLYNEFLTTNWNFLSNIENPDIAVGKFYEKLQEIFELHVPRFQIFRRKYPIWYNSDTIKLIKEKAKVHKQYKASRNITYYQRFCELRTAVKQSAKEACGNYLKNVQNQLKDNPKSFWSFVHQKHKASRIPGNMHNGDESHSNPTAIVNAFADFFKSVYDPSDNSDSGSVESNWNIMDIEHNRLMDINSKPVSEEEIILAGAKLKKKFTSGPD
nr:unnamed protein product [Callosobruchus chinensis]